MSKNRRNLLNKHYLIAFLRDSRKKTVILTIRRCCLVSLSALLLSVKPGFASEVASMSNSAYLRCFYRVESGSTLPKTNYVWALDSAGNGYYRIPGYWWADGVFYWKNMFYSDTSQAELASVCSQTLKHEKIQRPLAMMAAALDFTSLNYTVWSQDRPTQHGAIAKIIAFGDSLSDTQNMFNASHWMLPDKTSYFAGRYSNDKIWLDYLSEKLTLPVYNWAVGGAAADDHLVIPGLNLQVDSWAAYMRKAAGYQAKNSLFILFAGGNDLLDLNAYGSLPAQQDAIATSVVVAKRNATMKLINAGARHILVMNMPDISAAPVFGQRKDGMYIRAIVQKINEQLARLAEEIQATYGAGVRFRVLDVHHVFQRILADPGQFGLRNSTESCLNVTGSSVLDYATSWPVRAGCTNADHYVFWDRIHPTSRVHQLFATEAADLVRREFF